MLVLLDLQIYNDISVKHCLIDTSSYIYICVKHFGMENIKPFGFVVHKNNLGMPQDTRWVPAFAEAGAAFPIKC